MVALGKPRFEKGPITFQVGAPVAVGQLGMPGSGGTAGLVIPASAGITTCLGVATTDGLPAGTSNVSTTPEGWPILNVGLADENVAFARHGVYKLQASGAFGFGDHVKTGANGTVVRWVPGTDLAELQVGQCVDPAGGVSGSGSYIDLNL